MESVFTVNITWDFLKYLKLVSVLKKKNLIRKARRMKKNPHRSDIDVIANVLWVFRIM